MHENIWMLCVIEWRSNSLCQVMCQSGEWWGGLVCSYLDLFLRWPLLPDQKRGWDKDGITTFTQRKLRLLSPLPRWGKKGNIQVKATDLCVRRWQEPRSVVVNLAKQIVHLLEQRRTYILRHTHTHKYKYTYIHFI